MRRYWLFFLFAFLLFAGYFVLRLPNLTLQPIFADEAIYIRWAQVMKAEPTLRFLPVSDGKTPLWMWILMPFLKFVEDPLLAGRLLSVLCGSLTLLGVLFLGWKYFNIRTALWAGLLVVITPYIVFFDRMALVDSFLAAFSMWSLIFTLLLVEYKRLDIAMILGGILGGGWLTKTPGLFSVLSLPLGLVSFVSWKKSRPEAYRILGLMLVSIIIAVGFYNILRLGPGFDALSSRNGDYIHPPTHIFSSPFDPFIPHLRDLFDWFPKFITIPVLAAIFGGVILSLYLKHRVALVVLLWSLFPLVIEMALLKTFTTRYILFTVPPLLFLGGWFVGEGVSKLKVRKKTNGIRGLLEIGVILVLLLFTMPFNYKLWNAPETASIPRESRRGYFEDWTAGVGLKEIAEFLKQEAKTKKIVVGTAGAFGTLPDGLYIYLDKEPNISVMTGKASVSAELRNAAVDNDTFFVASKSQYGQPDAGLELLKEYPKAKGSEIPQDSMLLYRVLPEK
jgi:4-amino-4-deoxy-L-arabinose transferase-like glycosyltransferase